MRKIVARHNELNKFTETIENTFNQLFLLQITIITNVSLELPYLQVTFMILFIAYMTGDLYIYCYVAEKLNDRNSDLLVAVYECRWWALDKRDARSVQLIMERAQRPLQVTAGKFCVLSFRLFAIIGKTSLGYLSMLLAVKER
ncbi:odorant receptor 13a-like isoform X2 [Trichogramma pretiosum]|uniref:odorant receptor 13a-like isoform X2 n=1 Tax=Trichogramma pretiosum TaxID=7493 RepID=UPI000C71B92F|nr:odorant receptor 13a-like isoform X2 [Trichogramma pretiosum]